MDHVPMTIHMVTIILPPWLITQRNAWQWGAGARKGDIINPYIVAGTHQWTYKCEQT